MATNYFKIFGENTSNIKSNSEYNTLDERLTGFQPNTTVHSSVMNTALRQCSLITLAISDIIYDSGYMVGDSGPNMNYSDFKTYYKNYMDNYFKVGLGLKNSESGISVWDKSKLEFKTLYPSADDGKYVIGIKANTKEYSLIYWSDLEVKSAGSSDKVTRYIGNNLITAIFESNGTTVKNATDAVNANNLSNFLDESDGNTVKFSFGPVGNKTTFEHTISAPETIENAENVTTNINGKSISSIFESNGTTVKNATNSTNSVNATNATNAINATNSVNAENIKGGSENALLYQESNGVTKFIEAPTSSSVPEPLGWSVLIYNYGNKIYGWEELGYIKVRSSYKADSSTTSNSLNMHGKTVGSIPYKDIYGQFNYIEPPAKDSGNDYVLVSKYNPVEEEGMIPEWVRQQKITVVENSDGTVDVTITNV